MAQWDDSLPRFDPVWDDIKPRLVYRHWREWHWFRIYAVIFWLGMIAFVIYCSVTGWPS